MSNRKKESEATFTTPYMAGRLRGYSTVVLIVVSPTDHWSPPQVHLAAPVRQTVHMATKGRGPATTVAVP